MQDATNRVSIAAVAWQRSKAPSIWDWTPVVLFMGVSGDASAERRRRDREFEAHHYPQVAVLSLSGALPADGTYQLAPHWTGNGPQETDTREVNLRPWRLEGQVLRGQLTATGQHLLRRWLDAGLREVTLTPSGG